MSDEYDYVSTNPTKKEKRLRKGRGRVEGDSLYFFILHNTISMLIFFIIAVPLGLFTREVEMVKDLFSVQFVLFVFIVFALTFISGIMARIIGYIFMYYFTKNYLNKQLKTIGQFNEGINKIGLAYAISLFLSALLFSIGAITIIDSMIFSEQQTIITLIATYMLIKFLIFIFVKLLMNVK